MAMLTQTERRRPHSSRLEYRLLYAVCLMVCLPAALATRLLRAATGRPARSVDGSAFAEARAAASAAAGYALMS